MVPPAFGRAAVAVVCAVVILVSKAGILNPCISPVVPVMLLVPNIISPVMVPPAFGRAAVAVVCAVVILVSKAGILNPCISPVVPVTVRLPGTVVVIPVLPKVILVAVVLPIEKTPGVAVSTIGVNVDVDDVKVPVTVPPVKFNFKASAVSTYDLGTS